MADNNFKNLKREAVRQAQDMCRSSQCSACSEEAGKEKSCFNEAGCIHNKDKKDKIAEEKNTQSHGIIPKLDKDTLKKIWAIVSQAKEYKNNIYVATCTKNDPDMRTIVASAADELLNIKGVCASFVICDMEDSYFISARSLGDINVQTIMEKMGGGGHITVAATFIQCNSITECLDQLYKSIDSVVN